MPASFLYYKAHSLSALQVQIWSTRKYFLVRVQESVFMCFGMKWNTAEAIKQRGIRKKEDNETNNYDCF